MIGLVVSTKMAKTAVVLIERTAMHPLYKKTFLRTKKYLAHDPIGVKDGDMVEIIKVSPVSKNKHWRIVKVVGKNLEEITQQKLKDEAEKIVSEVMPEEKVSEKKFGKPKDQNSGDSDKSDKTDKQSSSEKKKTNKKKETK